MRPLRTALSLLLLSIAAPAAAQEPTTDAPFPHLATMDRHTDHSNVHAAVGVSLFGSDSGLDFAARFDLGGQYLTPQGFGGYLAMPVSHVSGDEESQTEIGNVELGGLYVLPAGPATDVVLHGGITLPTAPDDFDLLVNIIAMFPRTVDFTSNGGTITYLRLGASPLHRQGNLFVRADVGLDVPIAEDEGVEGESVFHLDVAAGVQTGAVTIAGELVNVGSLEDSDEEWLSTLALTVAGDAGNVRPFGALVLPIDNELAEQADLTLAIVAGIEAPFAN
jgi:hypothetical protein